NGIVKDYIIVSASGETAESAQSNALLRIKERIISSIAENIQTSSEYYRGEKSVNGVTNFIENYETFTKTKAADIGFVKGISLSKAEEYYWEKVSEDGKIKYYYHIKYPFSERDLAKLVLDFEMADKQLTEEMNTIIDSIPYINRIEQITEYSRSLQTLSKAFIDTRKQKAELYINKLNEMLRSITIYPLEEKLGEIKYTLRYNDKTIYTAATPRITSNCAKITDTRNEGEFWIIRYNYSGCYDDPSNVITVVYPVSSSLRKDFSFDINANKAEIMLRDEIVLTAPNTNSDQLSQVQCNMVVYSKYNSPLTIEKVTLNWENYPPIVVEGIKYEIKGRGEYNVSFTLPQSLDKKICNPSTKNTISGSIQFRGVTGELLTYRIYNQRYKSNW
ncbi:MAG: hypothetical protein N2662_09355, partial [Bacteroidales bacterium]|nr:hypothetical protein [Bacteroidales bacterium]